MASAEEIAVFAYRAGFSGADLAKAIAIALAESGGRTDARGDVGLQTSTWGPSIGLWQIRSLNAEKGKGTTRDETANLDPQTNAKHAYEIYKSQGLGAWTVYNTRAYLLHMPRATAAAAGVTVTAPAVDAASNATGAVTDTAGAVLNAVQEPIRMLQWLQEAGTQLRIAKVMIGGALVIGAMYIFVWPQLYSATKIATSVVTKGAK